MTGAVRLACGAVLALGALVGGLAGHHRAETPGTAPSGPAGLPVGPAAAGPAAGGASGQGSRDPARGPSRSAVPREVDAARQLARARAAKRGLVGATGRARWEARVRAAEAYRAVRRYFPHERELGAEAAFRAGELWRSAGEEAAALAEFQAAVDLDPGGSFGVRARLEIGDLHRRLERPDAALASYASVLVDARAQDAHRARAALWAGRVHAERGEFELARALWEPVAHGDYEPCTRVAAFDLLALELISRGDLEGAAGTLAQCRTALVNDAHEATESGAQVRRALERMRAIDALARAVSQRRERVRIGGGEPSSAR